MNLKYVNKTNKYQGIDFVIDKTVMAQYTAPTPHTLKGNPFIDALPLMLSENKLFLKCLRLLQDYNPKEAVMLSNEDKEIMIQQLSLIRIPPPYLQRIYAAFYQALQTTYKSREFRRYNVPVTVKNQQETIAARSISNGDGDAGNGFTILGTAGSGKSSSMKMILEQFPQLIIHKNDDFGQLIQIVYVKVNCLPNSNISGLLDNIGAEVDKILHNTSPIYENEVKKARNIGAKINVVSRLIEIFNIGALILDEIQLLDFSANKEASFESVLAITNNTKVSIVAIGTEDAYGKMFPNLRTARRTGMCINIDMDVFKKSYYSEAIKILWSYQWFDEYIPKLPKEIGEAMFFLTRGVIDQVIKIYMYMQLEYVRSEIKPIIDKNYVFEIAEKYYPGILKLNKNNKLVNHITKEEGQLTSKEVHCLQELKKLFSITNQIYNDDKIIHAIQIATKRSPKASHKDIIKAAYNHLIRHKSDARFLPKSDINIDEERDLILSTKAEL